VKGNLLIHDDIYLVQFKHDPADLNDLTIPAIHDQLTNTHNHGAQAMRKKDLTPWTCWEIFQLGFGVFHLIMNLIWALLHTYRGTLSQSGSLSHLFSVLEKVQLNADHPDFHTLLGALTQILDGLILNVWHDISGFSSFDAFVASNPTPSALLDFAHILQKYATPSPKFKPATKPPKSSNADNDADASGSEDDTLPMKDTSSKPSAPPLDVTLHYNVVCLTCDLLYVIELVKAVSDGDFGQVEDILPDLVCIFHAAGSNNYSMEVLHFLVNLKEVWTPEFAYICVQVLISALSNKTIQKYHA
jgi:hypothetical protein